MASDLEIEARAYWSGVKRFRVMSGLGADTTELADDLEVIAMYSTNKVIAREITALLSGVPASKRVTAS